ncbi:hypothetical protein COLO4_33233 [Corchorus olitorius]|uniref:Uncharacterized protein n=1 Tax=Corchorus olitorius TaxID=93759 RepID=A0A1R3GVG1_9ROSI|nr:hypothetical protein COLO4_33233 [Corchorus olitorius]
MAPGKVGRKRKTQSASNVSRQPNIPAEQVLPTEPAPAADLQQNVPIEPNLGTPASDLQQNVPIEPTLGTQDANVNSVDTYSVPPKKVRGPTRGVGLEKLIKGRNKLLIEIPKGKGRPVSEVQSAKLSSEIGLIVRNFISIPTKWKGLTEADKLHFLERLQGKCEKNKISRQHVKFTHNQGSRAFVASRYAKTKFLELTQATLRDLGMGLSLWVNKPQMQLLQGLQRLKVI